MNSSYFEVAPGVWGSEDIFVNFYFIEASEKGYWVLVDTGLSKSAGKIKKIAEELFGEGVPPDAIILTHGHADHAGSVIALAHHWHVPVYAHYLELPYLTGLSSYPPADPSVSGGLISKISPLFSRGPINLEGAANALPDDNSVPFLSDWKWIHTPGHAPGHVSFYREEDKVLIVGDAFTTTKPEYVNAYRKNAHIISGPPKYYTPDWVSAEASVKALSDLQPNIAASGHGMPMEGVELQEELQQLADNFKLLAVPPAGRYVDEPALFDATGVLYVPPKIKQPINRKLIGLIAGASVLAGVIAFLAVAESKKKKKWWKKW